MGRRGGKTAGAAVTDAARRAAARSEGQSGRPGTPWGWARCRTAWARAAAPWRSSGGLRLGRATARCELACGTVSTGMRWGRSEGPTRRAPRARRAAASRSRGRVQRVGSDRALIRRAAGTGLSMCSANPRPRAGHHVEPEDRDPATEAVGDVVEAARGGVRVASPDGGNEGRAGHHLSVRGDEALGERHLGGAQRDGERSPAGDRCRRRPRPHPGIAPPGRTASAAAPRRRVRRRGRGSSPPCGRRRWEATRHPARGGGAAAWRGPARRALAIARPVHEGDLDAGHPVLLCGCSAGAPARGAGSHTVHGSDVEGVRRPPRRIMAPTRAASSEAPSTPILAWSASAGRRRPARRRRATR